MNHAAVLSVLVKAEGVAQTAAKVEALERDLERAAGAGDEFAGSLDKADRATRQVGGGADHASKKVDSLANDLNKATATANAASKSTGSFADDLNRAAGTADRARESTRAAHEQTSKYATETARATSTTRSFSSVLNEARAATEATDAATARAANSSRSLGSDLERARLAASQAAGSNDRHATSTTRVAQESAKSSRAVRDMDAALDKFVRSSVEAADAAKRTGDRTRGLGDDSDHTHRRMAAFFGGIGGGITRLAGLSGAFGPVHGHMQVLVAVIVAALPVLLALSGALFAIIAALGPLVGLAGAAAVGLGALAQAASVVGLASMGVGDALKEQIDKTDKVAKAAQSSANQQKSAARAIESAQDGVRAAHDRVRAATEQLADAQRAERKAVEALAPARQQAKRDLEDLRAALGASVLDGRQAVIALKDARKQLADALAPVDALRLADAQATLTNSTMSEQRAVLSLTDARERLANLFKPADALTLADAQDAVADAARGETRAQLALIRAREDAQKILDDPTATDAQKAAAKLDLADAENAVGDAARASVRAQQQLQKIQAGPSEHEIAKAKLDVAEAEQAVADAARGTAHAQRGVQEAMKGVDLDQVAKARLQVAQAEKQLADALRQHGRLERDLRAAEKAGINGAPGVVSARERIAEASRQVTAAERDLAEAGRGVDKAMKAVRDAQIDAAASAGAAAIASADLDEKFNKLPPAAQEFVRALIGLKPKLDDLRATAAQGLFPGVTAGLQSATGLFGPLKTVVAQTAGVIGGLAKRFGELLGSSGFGKDFETIGGRNAQIIDRLGRAAIYLFDALRHLMVAAGPLTTWLAQATLEWAKHVAAAAEAGRESGKMADFFQKARNTLITVTSIVRNLGSAFYNMGKQAAPFGRDMLDSIDRVMRRFSAWSKSVEGQHALQDFFAQSTELAGKLMPALGGVLGSLGQMAFRVMPAYVAVLNALGPLAGPLIQAFVVWKLAVTAAAVATSLATAAQEVYTAVTKGGIVYTIAAKVAMFAASAAAKAWAAGQWLLNAALSANPIGLVVIGLAALVAGLVLAYKKSETFRNIVQAAFNAVKSAGTAVFGWIKDNWSLLGGILTAPFAPFIALIRTFGDDIVAGLRAGLDALGAVFLGPLKAAWNAVLDFFGVHSPSRLFMQLGGYLVDGLVAGLKAGLAVIVGAAKWLGDQLVAGIKAYVSVYKDVGSWIIARVVDGVQAVAAAVASAAGWLKNRFVEGVRAYIDAFKTVGSWVLERIVDGFKAVVSGISGAAGWIKNRFVEFVHAEVEGFTRLGGWVVDKVVDGVKAVPGLVSAVGGWLKNRLKDGLDAAKDGFVGLGGSVIDWIVTGMKNGANLLVGFLNKIIDVVNKIPGVEIKHIPKFPTDKDGNVEGFARGGAFARTGGIVNQPITLMGEEAPRFAEYVIPTNPAYRGRAQVLAMQAAKAVGLAQGGVYSQGEIEDLWVKAGGPAGQAKIAGAVGMAESSGDTHAVGPMTKWGQAKGLMQILGSVLPGDLFDAMVNMRNAVQKWRDAGGWSPWEAFTGPDGKGADGSYLKFMGGGGKGLFGKIGDAIGGAVSSVKDAISGFVGKLPGIGDLPDWVKGLGSNVLGKVKDWIKDKVTGIFGGGGGGGGKVDGLQPAVQHALEFAREHGWTGSVTSGFRSYAEQAALYQAYLNGTGNRAAPPGNSNHEKGLAVDVTMAEQFQAAMDQMGAGALMRKVAGEPWHFSTTGYRMGGMYGGMGLLGSYATGTPYVPATGPYLLHKGEAVVDADTNRRSNAPQGGPLVNIEHAEFKSEADLTVFSRELGFQLN